MELDIYDYMFRIVAIGDSGVGKSSLIRFFVDRKPINPRASLRPTVGADYFIRVIKAAPDSNTKIRLEIWDTAGQERYRAITKSYYRNSIGVLLVFDVTSHQSFDHILDWYEESRVHILPHKAVYILVGNKTDLSPREVTKQEASAFAREHGMAYVETSPVTGQKVDESFTSLGQTIFQRLRSGEIQAESGWEAVKDHSTDDKRVKLSVFKRDDPNLAGTRCG